MTRRDGTSAAEKLAKNNGHTADGVRPRIQTMVNGACLQTEFELGLDVLRRKYMFFETAKHQIVQR